MIICGATGDLTERKLAPALYNCFLDGFLPPEFTGRGLRATRLDATTSSATICWPGSTSTAATTR